MMALDALNNLHQWPLPGFAEFVVKCQKHGVTEVNLTGTNTDPLLFEHHKQLVAALRDAIPEVVIGIRTNVINAMIDKYH